MRTEPDVRPNGAAIRAFREKGHRTRADVARFAGLKPQSLTNIENGQRSTTLGVIRLIAEILDVPVDAITREDTGAAHAEDAPAEPEEAAAALCPGSAPTGSMAARSANCARRKA